MKHFIKQNWKKIGLFMLVIFTFVYIWNQGGFMSVKGKAIMSHVSKQGEEGIYSITPTILGGSRNLYLATPEYEDIDYFEACDGNILFSGKKKNSGYFVLLEYKDKKLEELMTTSKPIQWSVWSKKNQELLCVILEDKKRELGYLYRYDMKEKTLKKVIDELVAANQKPLVMPTGEILFVTKKRQPHEIINTIHILHNDNQIEDLIEYASNLCWCEEGKTFFYVTRAGGSIYEYDIETKKSRVICKDAYACDLMLTPDKKHLVFIKDGLSWISTEVATLCVLNIEDGKIKVLDNLRKFWKHGETVGWIQ